MSTSGQTNGTNVDGSEGSYISWQLSSQNLVDNYSVITWQVGWRFSTVSCRGLRLGQGIVNGTVVYNDTDGGDGVHAFVSGHDHRPKLQTASGSINIPHNADGTKAFQTYCKMTGWQGKFSEGATWWELPVIPRFSGPPSTPVISSITSSSVFATFSDGTGGAAIDSREIGYGTDPITPVTIISSDGSTSITGLTPGTTYYFWARTHNVAGYSPWSSRATAVTLRVPDAPNISVISDVTQVSAIVTFTPNGDGGAAITAYEVGYGTSSSSPTVIVSATSPKTITNLNPGVKYYFWVRAQNSVGWSPWSVSSNVTTIAGARVKVGTEWKQAVPYVRVGGVWKLARPWVRSLGIWKETT